MAYHDCDLCSPIIQQIIKPHIKHVQDDVAHSKPVNLGSLNHLLGASATCEFHNFILRIHDQVRPSYALAPARGMPECSATNSRVSRIHVVLADLATTKIASGKRQVWSNFVDFVENVNGRDIPVQTKWRAMFRLISDDAAAVHFEEGSEPTELGRLLDPYSACGPTFWRECFGTCLEEHTGTCGTSVRHDKPSVLPDSMRVLDLKDQTIAPLPKHEKYAVLSYVWGNTNFLQLTKATYAEMTIKGSLLDLQKPKTIYDAMIVAQALDIRYLWIDALCIIQDDEDDKMEQVHRMGQIYKNAVLTIVGARAGHADGGLWPSEHRSQIIGEGGGLKWLSAAPTLPDAVKLSAWAKRAWTYQEAAFSRRTLVFTEHQAYYSCKRSAWAEDYIRSTADGSDELEYLEEEDDDSLPSTIERLTSYPPSWSHLLEQYTTRRLTFESDVLIASAGVVASYLTERHDVALCGLPVDMLFEYSLLWKASTDLVRRTRPKPNGGYMFPSWSWAGWSGAVGYDGTDHDYRQYVEAARCIHTWRFTCDDLKNKTYTNKQLRHQKTDHFLTDTDIHTSSKVSLQTVQQGTLIFRTLTARLRIGKHSWNQFMESDDESCKYTGYYKLFNEEQWIGSVHLEHDIAKELNHRPQEVIVLSTTGGRGPTYLAPLPHVSDQVQDDTWRPLCDPILIKEGNNEMYNVMLVTRTNSHNNDRYRAGVGQVHRSSFLDMNNHERDVWLE